jgi:riboflavin kinase/FMN adenylyltransferase
VTRQIALEQIDPAGRAIAIGSFDGVHLGHRAVIERAMALAAESGLLSSVVTFHPHPVSVLRPELAPRDLSTPQRKHDLVAEIGPDELVVIRFDVALSRRTHEEFERDVIAGALGTRHVVVGDNFRYGNRAQGTVETLRAAGDALGFTVEPAPLVVVGGAAVSSSRIRDLIAGGDVAAAGRLLGRDPWVEGTVVRGDGRGRGLGFATANLRPVPHSALPARGVYAGSAHLPGARSLPAAVSVGYNPTFSDARDQVRIEAHLLDFDEDIYGSPLRIDFAQRLRDEERFGSIDELVAQIHRDVEAVRASASG